MRNWIMNLCLCACVTVSEAAFEVQPNSVKAMSLGRAFMASGNEASALFINPAGPALMTSSEISLIYSKPYVGLPGVNMDIGSMAFIIPTKAGNFGAGLGTFVAPGLKQERTIGISYSKKVSIFARKLRFGLTGKHLYHSYLIGSDQMVAGDPVFSKGTSRSAFSLDAGMIISIVGPLNLGLAVRNINRPDVGLVTEDRVAREIQGGIVIDIAGVGLRVNGDLYYRDKTIEHEQIKLLPFLGLEKGLYRNKVMLRIGENPLEYSGGVGLNMGKFRLDYGVVINRNLIQDNAGTHQIGVIYSLGK